MIINDLDGKFKPSNLSAYERYEALIPIMSEASETYLRIFSETRNAVRDTQIHSRLTELFTKVASNSVMSVEEVRRAFLGFTVKGFSGLMTPQPLSAVDMVTSSVGTWELVARTTNGGHTVNAHAEDSKSRARSNIYYQQVGPMEMIELVTMWNDENHYPRDTAIAQHKLGPEGTFVLAAMTRSTLTQIDDYTVQYAAKSEVCGNHGYYQSSGCGDARVLLMKLDGETTFVSLPEGDSCTAPDAQVAAANMYLLMNVSGSPEMRKYTMSGLPPMHGDTRTMDVTDHYVKVSEKQPLVGGWEPIEAYYKRLKDVPGHATAMAERAVPNGPVHGFHAPGGLEELKKFA